MVFGMKDDLLLMENPDLFAQRFKLPKDIQLQAQIPWQATYVFPPNTPESDLREKEKFILKGNLPPHEVVYAKTFQISSAASPDNPNAFESSISGVSLSTLYGKAKSNEHIAFSKDQDLKLFPSGTTILAQRKIQKNTPGQPGVEIEFFFVTNKNPNKNQQVTMPREDQIEDLENISKKLDLENPIHKKLLPTIKSNAGKTIDLSKDNNSSFDKKFARFAKYLSLGTVALLLTAYNFDTISGYFSDFMSNWFPTYFGQK